MQRLYRVLIAAYEAKIQRISVRVRVSKTSLVFQTSEVWLECWLW